MTSEFQPQITQMNTDESVAEEHLRSSVSSAAKKEISPKISVIVPVYKVEKYLPECIESVLAQTFTDFELILVDDGSPDNCGKICDDYAARDSRIRVFHKPNGGVSSARNLGLDHARGEWIAFVDPDDWIDEKMLEKMFAAGTECGSDFVWCDFWTESDSMIVLHRQTVVSADEKNMIEGFLSGRLHGSVGIRLIRAAALRENEIYFSPEIGFCEDLLFSIRLAKCARKMKRVPQPLYHYRIREGAATSNLRTRKALSDFVFVLESARDLLADKPEFDAVLEEAFCRQKAKMLSIPACPTAEIRSLECSVPEKSSLTCEEKILLFGFAAFGRLGALALALFFRTISFAKSKFREAIIMLLQKKYAHDGFSVRVLIAPAHRCDMSSGGGYLIWGRPTASNELRFSRSVAEPAKEAA